MPVNATPSFNSRLAKFNLLGVIAKNSHGLFYLFLVEKEKTESETKQEELEPIVERVTGPAGTAVIFTEALTHGTLPWAGSDERRTVFFKYSPASVSWSAKYYDPSKYSDLNETQRIILEGPNDRYRGRDTNPVGY